MVRSIVMLTAAAALAVKVYAQSMYSRNSAVLQVTSVDYDRLITKSNYTSIVEFYAPWCGHCKNLKPAYESAAKSLAGIAKVAAVNCDDEMNKSLCGQMGVQGFPTLKIVRPGKKPGKPTVEDYQGQRQAKAIVEIVKDKVPNTVKRVTDKNLDEWLKEHKETAKAILFSDKGVISATLRTLAIDFAGLIPLAQIKKTELGAIEKYGIEKYPTLILLTAAENEPVKYDGEMKKEDMVKFLSQVAQPNLDCPEPKVKKPKAKKEGKKHSKASSKFSKASASHKSSEASSAATSAQYETVEEANKPTESPDPKVETEDTPIIIRAEQSQPTIRSVAGASELQAECLNEKSLTCVFAVLPADESSQSATNVVATLASIHKKHDALNSNLFPFVAVPKSNPLWASLVHELKLGDDDQTYLVAVHGKRAWYKAYAGKTFGSTAVEKWIDSLRMGEGKKEKLPTSLIGGAEQEPLKQEKAADQEPIKTEVAKEPETPSDPYPAPEHGEL